MKFKGIFAGKKVKQVYISKELVYKAYAHPLLHVLSELEERVREATTSKEEIMTSAERAEVKNALEEQE